MRKIVALLGGCIFIVLIFLMYMALDQFSRNSSDEELFKTNEYASNSLAKMEHDINGLEKSLDKSQETIDKIEETLRQKEILPKQSKGEESNVADSKRHEVDQVERHGKLFRPIKKQPGKQNEYICKFSEQKSGDSADIKMLDVFDEISFDNPDGGAWKQGWDIQYKKDAFDEKQLLIFVVPHSHNDPGWIKTVDQYYEDQTRHILDNVVDALGQNRRRKFIWAEISYFSMWWANADERRKRLAKDQIENGQLEIVTGGWVMNDEANPHYYAMIDHLIEGHQWLERHLGVKPKAGWAIDPFGHSPTMAYILKRAGLDAMLIQRTHYSVKKYLARKRDLEFMWRQNWAHSSSKSTDIFCHMMPFYSYDVPHTCGPDPKVCCQFDFRRLPGGGHFCPWMVPPVEINSENVAERAMMLLDQYRKKAQLYKNNIVLAPLGDDFRYEIPFETEKQYGNYQVLMDYINNHSELKAKIQFGTLSDYFDAVWKRTGVKPGAKPPGHAVLSGDFFTYADRDDHYWSGYYTSRSFYKNLDRVLETHHRAAEILFTLASVHARKVSSSSSFPINELFHDLIGVRRDLGLFQHHDGITGTAKDHVVVDYGKRLLRSINKCKNIMEEATKLLMLNDKKQFKSANKIKFVDSLQNHDSLASKEVIIISKEPSTIIVYNSLAQERAQVITVHVSEPLVEVEDSNFNMVESQTSLIWNREQRPNGQKYELSFIASTPPLGISIYRIKRSSTGSPAAIEFLNEAPPRNANDAFKMTSPAISEDILIRNEFLEAVFDPAIGMLMRMTLASDKTPVKMGMKFMVYGTRNAMDKSGAYLFLPDGNAREITVASQAVVVTRGKVFSEVRAQLQYSTVVSRIYHVDVDEAKAVEIRNFVDIRDSFNTELVMRVQSGIKNENREFFTDLNGFQMQKRKTLDKLPLQANFYPLPATAFLQDSKRRLTIHSAQANGVASLRQGFIEVVLDRRLFQDDNRGLGQGVTDNKITPSNFLIFLESFSKEQERSTSPIAYPSQNSIALMHRLQHPMFVMTAKGQLDPSLFSNSYQGLHASWPCDQFLLNLRTIQNKTGRQGDEEAVLLIHRIAYDCKFQHLCQADAQQVSFSQSFAPLEIKSLKATSLTLMHDKGVVDPNDVINVEPMEINAYRMVLK